MRCSVLTTVPVLVANGTGANLIALQACLTRPWDAVVCSQVAHINVDEGGAPERILGSKLVALPTADGRLHAEQLAGVCERLGDEHAVQPTVLSVTQSTEYGTVYKATQAAALAAEARRLGMRIHVDGARLANAAVALGCGLGEVAEMFDADVVSVGGTKNGLMGAEAVVFRTPELAEQVKWVRKATTQLISKHRYLAAQFLAMLSDDLWRRTAQNANAMAQRLAAGSGRHRGDDHAARRGQRGLRHDAGRSGPAGAVPLLPLGGPRRGAADVLLGHHRTGCRNLPGSGAGASGRWLTLGPLVDARAVG